MNKTPPEIPAEIAPYLQDTLVPTDVLQREFRAALAAAGYHSRDDILALVQEVKREIADEELGACPR